jgi:hypothetical protein
MRERPPLLLAWGWGTLRYRSALIGIAVHSAQSIVVLGLVFALVLKG